MHNLRDAIGKEEKLNVAKPGPSASIRTHRNNDSQSMWSIGMGLDDEQDQDKSIQEVERMQKLINLILAYQHQNTPANEETVKELIRSQEKYLSHHRTQKDKMEEFIKKLSQILIKAPVQLQPYISKLQDAAKSILKKIKSKNHNGAKQFDQIADKLFKKQTTKVGGTKENKKKILQANLLPDAGTKNMRKNRNNHDSNGTKNSGSGSQESGEGKLGKLLSSDKYEKKKSAKEEQREQNEGPQESYTFSAVFNATTVRQRPRIGKKQKQVVDMTNVKHKVNEQDEILDNDREDDAFIFFRPKRNRR